MAFYYLLLGHLIGDFVLQTNKIAENKGKYWQWNLLHVLVVTFCIGILSYQFGLMLLAMVAVSGSLHYFIDFYKASVVKFLNIPEIAGFILDQSIHIVIIYLISLAAIYNNSMLINFLSVKYMLVLVYVTSFSAVLNQYVLSIIFPGTGGKFFEPGEKHIGILTRIFLAVVFYLVFFESILFIFLVIPFFSALFLMHTKFHRSRWATPFQLSIKLVLDTGIAAIGICTIKYISMIQ